MRGLPTSKSPSPPCDAEQAREASLVQAVAAGELGAFERLYRHYHPRLTRFLERVTHRPALVEELLDDTMLVVWRRAARYHGGSKVSTWIFAIAYRKALKALCRRRRDDAAAQDDNRVCDEPGPEQHAGASERRTLLLQALRELTPEHRAVLELTYFQGLSCAEIAQVLDCPVATVKTRMFYARRRLRALLSDLEDRP
jgi:RNA polymerase sigma-70 factor (ECF subfamily)